MRAISPYWQTGVVPHVFSRLEYLAQARSSPKSTQGSASPLLFGQDLVKVSASHFEPATFALATNPSGVHEPSGCSPNRHDPAISLGSAASTESLSRYPGVSPFPLALLDYQFGLMWMNEGRLEDARRSFEAARRLVPPSRRRRAISPRPRPKRKRVSAIPPLPACGPGFVL